MMIRTLAILPLERHATVVFAKRSIVRLPMASRQPGLVSSFAKQTTNSSSPHVSYHRTASALRWNSRTLSNASMNLVRSSLFSQKQSSLLFQTQLGSLSYFSSNQFGGNGRKPPGNNMLRSAGLVTAGAAVLFGKGKYILAGLKLTKLASLGSMVLTIGTYSAFFGFPYAVGMVGLITVHEIGHALVMMQRGIPFSPMVFVPFMGAMITMDRRPRDAWEDALVAFGGPVLGSVGAGVVAIGAHMTNSQLLFALADFGFMINMFNLIPIGKLDGGRIGGALSPWTHVAGLGLGTTLALNGAISNPIFYLILLAGGWETFQRFYNPGSIPPNYYRITPVQRTAIGLGYVGLVGGLIVAMDVNERFKKPPEVLMRERQMEMSWDMR